MKGTVHSFVVDSVLEYLVGAVNTPERFYILLFVWFKQMRYNVLSDWTKCGMTRLSVSPVSSLCVKLTDCWLHTIHIKQINKSCINTVFKMITKKNSVPKMSKCSFKC